MRTHSKFISFHYLFGGEIIAVPRFIGFMDRQRWSLVLTLARSEVIWPPAAIELSIDFPRWTLLFLIRSQTAFSAFCRRVIGCVLSWQPLSVSSAVCEVRFFFFPRRWRRQSVHTAGNRYCPLATTLASLL